MSGKVFHLTMPLNPQDDAMAQAANAAAAAAIGLGAPGLCQLATAEQLATHSMPAPAVSGPAPEIVAAAEGAAGSVAQSIAQAAPAAAAASSTREDADGNTPAAEAPTASAAASGDVAADEAMPDPSQAAAAPPEAAPAPDIPEQMTQAYPAAAEALGPSQQMTQEYPAPMEADEGGEEHLAAAADASMAQQPQQGDAAEGDAHNSAPMLRPDGKPLVAGSAIFTKVSPMKGKVGFSSMAADRCALSACQQGCRILHLLVPRSAKRSVYDMKV